MITIGVKGEIVASIDEGPADVQMVDLDYMVATLAKDGKWYVRAGFATKELAEAYANGMAVVGVKTKVVWDDPSRGSSPKA
jgi:hypothetical protein